MSQTHHPPTVEEVTDFESRNWIATEGVDVGSHGPSSSSSNASDDLSDSTISATRLSTAELPSSPGPRHARRQKRATRKSLAATSDEVPSAETTVSTRRGDDSSTDICTSKRPESLHLQGHFGRSTSPTEHTKRPTSASGFERGSGYDRSEADAASLRNNSLSPRRVRSEQHEHDMRPRTGSPRGPPSHASKPRKPDPFSFLESDSPNVTDERIQQVVARASGEWSPRSESSASSNGSNSQRSIAETDATTPEPSVNGDMVSTIFTQIHQPPEADEHIANRRATRVPEDRLISRKNLEAQAQSYLRYGTPEMARGPAKLPVRPPSELQPRPTVFGQGHPKHLPRAERLPMTGYELVAAKLSSASSTRSQSRKNAAAGPHVEDQANIKPIYRRFEALNHRLLLHLQDELSELEEQLHRLDTADTQTRRLQNCILPASRRAESMSGGELQWRRTDMLGKIGFKLNQYNNVLTSFAGTMNLPAASTADIEEYRTFLATQNPIAEAETRFLDPAEDLICLPRDRSRRSSSSSTSSLVLSPTAEDLLTPMPRKMTFGFGRRPSTSTKSSWSSTVVSNPPQSEVGEAGSQQGKGVADQRTDGEPMQEAKASLLTSADLPSPRLDQAAVLAAVAVVAPILVFPFIRDFMGRMAVVIVSGLAVLALRGKLAEGGFRAQIGSV